MIYIFHYWGTTEKLFCSSFASYRADHAAQRAARHLYGERPVVFSHENGVTLRVDNRYPEEDKRVNFVVITTYDGSATDIDACKESLLETFCSSSSTVDRIAEVVNRCGHVVPVDVLSPEEDPVALAA